MKRIGLIGFALFCFVLKIKTQNLVPNPSFENNLDCSYPLLSNAVPWSMTNSGAGQSSYYNACLPNPNATPSQYLDACFKSYQVPHSGVSYIDIGSYVMSSNQESTIPQVKLIDTLKAGKIYCVTFYVSVWNNAKYTIDKLGALLTPTPFPYYISGTTTPSFSIAGQYPPQVVSTPSVAIGDTLNWTEVSGSFTAFGNEAYLAIGDFFTHAQHYILNKYPTNCNGLAYYYVDDVSVEVVEIAKTKNDTLIYATDSVIIGNNASEAAVFSWQPTVGLSCTNCPNPKASPSVTTTYTVTKTQCKAITTDVITITVSPVGLTELNITNAITLQPNPTNGMITISSRFEMQKVEVINVAGQVLLNESTTDKIHQLNLTNFAQGIYFIKVNYSNGLNITKKVIVNP